MMRHDAHQLILRLLSICAVVGLGLTLMMGHNTDATLVAEHEAEIAARASRTRRM
jgi:hypothetical protein